MTNEVMNGIAIDNGSWCLRMGTVGDVPRHATITPETLARESTMKSSLEIPRVHPVEHGMVTNWHDWELMVHHILPVYFNNATTGEQQSPRDHALYITEAPLTPRGHRSKVTELAFESFGFGALMLPSTASCSLYSSGRTTGVVVDIGVTRTTIVPIWEGAAIPYAIQMLHVGGGHISSYLAQLLHRKANNTWPLITDQQLLHDIKLTSCYITKDFEHELKAHSVAGRVATYHLPGMMCNR